MILVKGLENLIKMALSTKTHNYVQVKYAAETILLYDRKFLYHILLNKRVKAVLQHTYIAQGEEYHL